MIDTFWKNSDQVVYQNRTLNRDLQAGIRECLLGSRSLQFHIKLLALLQQNKIVGNIIHKIPYNVVFLQFFDKFLICANINFVCDKDDGTIFSAKMFDFFCPFELHICHAVRAIKRFQLVFIMKSKHVTP